MLDQMLSDAAAWPVYPREYYPPFSSELGWERVAEGWRMSRIPRSQVQDGDQFDPGGMLDLFVGRDGTAQLFCGRAGYTPKSGPLQLFEDNIASLTTRFLYLMGMLYHRAGYEGPVDVALAVTGAEGTISGHSASMWIGVRNAPYEREEYLEVRQFAATSLRRDPRARHRRYLCQPLRPSFHSLL